MGQLTTVKLLGKLGQTFGREFKLYIERPRDVIALLQANFGNFYHYLLQSHEQNMGYRVIVHGMDLAEPQLDLTTSAPTIILCPAIYGSGGAFVRILAGAALVGIGVWTGFAPVALLGASLILGGIAQLLSPTPDEKVDRSYFDGPLNTSEQGRPVPLCYGRLIVGSHVISAGITLDKLVTIDA